MRDFLSKISLTGLLLLVVATAWGAGKVSFEASSPLTVSVGEAFRVEFSLNASPDDDTFKAPSFEGFDVLAGPVLSTGSSVQIVNGSMTRSVSVTYTFVLLPQAAGNVTIGAAEVAVDGTVYRTDPLPVEIVDEGTAAQQRQSPQSGQSGTQAERSDEARSQSEAQGRIGKQDILLRAVVSRTSVYKNEPLHVAFKLYTRVPVVDVSVGSMPSFNGFWSQDLTDPNASRVDRETYNGKVYETRVLLDYLLYPQQSGTIRIDPMSCDVIVRLRQQRQVRNFFDDFFDTYQDVKRPLRTPPVNINVSALPQPKPADFSGAVGSLSLSSEVSTTELNAHESMTLTLKIKGSGNMKMIKTPEIDFPQDFETYEPKVTNNFKTTASGVSGTKTIEYLAIPRHDGNFTIPSVSISYYDTKDEKYKTISTDSYNIRVNKGQSSDVQQGTVVSNYTSQEQVQVLASDIRYINTKPLELKDVPTVFAGSPQFWMVYLVPLLVSCGLLFFFRKQARENADVALMRNRKANKVARKRLKVAETEWKSGNKERFYDEILKALWGYLCDKLSMPLSDLNKENVASELEQHAVPADVIETFIGLLHKCEFEQYAPLTDSRAAMDKIFEETISMISTLEGCIKKK